MTCPVTAGAAAPILASQEGDMPSRPVDTAPVGPLLAAAAAGERAAWDSLVDRFTGLLWAVARAHRLRDSDAADVVQTTWLRLVENLGRIEDPERLPGWLATTARRECLAVLHRSHREPAYGDDGPLRSIPDPRGPLDSALLTHERDAALWALVDELPERCRALIRVLLADPPPAYAEVAAALDMPVGSIGPTRQRCLSSLRSLAIASGALDPGDVDLADQLGDLAAGGAP
jgi:RNA polymerase sigma factor (sigma-70 family)